MFYFPCEVAVAAIANNASRQSVPPVERDSGIMCLTLRESEESCLQKMQCISETPGDPLFQILAGSERQRKQHFPRMASFAKRRQFLCTWKLIEYIFGALVREGQCAVVCSSIQISCEKSCQLATLSLRSLGRNYNQSGIDNTMRPVPPGRPRQPGTGAAHGSVRAGRSGERDSPCWVVSV